ncbi:MAG TPA: energy-coupling factor transporter transmembrane component T [Bryobacteraceae bacterium]|nr:energy-coupling factor transporter transmembrane component T [Bryobacteraceae bacterium]
MHHRILERWSRGTSPIHGLDPRAKIAALLVFLIVLATAHRSLALLSAGLFLLLAGGVFRARLPLWAVIERAALVLPFSLVFAIISWAAGDPARGLSLLAKSYLSALAVLLVVATTPLPSLLSGLEQAGVPRFLLLVGQFLYRYLFVIVEEAQCMRAAAAARAGSARAWLAGTARFGAAAGALAVLFARSYGRAEHIHRAMLARGFQGNFQKLERNSFRMSDAGFALTASLAVVALRLAAERLAW